MAEQAERSGASDASEKRGVSRRTTLRRLGAGGLPLLAGCAALSGTDESETASPGSTRTATATDGPGTAPVRIGVVVEDGRTGPYKHWAHQTLWGFYAGLAHEGASGFPAEVQFGKQSVTVDDIQYRLTVRSPELDFGRITAHRLVDGDGVDVIFGTRTDFQNQYVITGIEEANGHVPFVAGPSAAMRLPAGRLCRDWVFHTGETFAMDGRTGARYLLEDTDVSSVFLVARKYEHTPIVDNYRRILVESDVTVLGQRILYQDVDWPAVLNLAARRGADAVVVGAKPFWWAGAYAALLDGDYDVRLIGPSGGYPSFQKLAAVLNEHFGSIPAAEELRAAGIGPFTSRYHWTQYDNPTNAALTGFMREEYAETPDEFAACSFTGASAIHQAVRAVRSGDADSIQAALRGATVEDTPKGAGAYTFQTYNNQARSPMTVTQLGPASQAGEAAWDLDVVPDEPLARIPANRTTLPEDSPAMGCTL